MSSSKQQSLHTYCVLHSGCGHLETAGSILEKMVVDLENGMRAPNAIAKDLQGVCKALSVHRTNLETVMMVLAPTVGIPSSALKKIENEKNLKRSIETGQGVDGTTNTNASAVKRLRLYANSENKKTPPSVLTTASPKPALTPTVGIPSSALKKIENVNNLKRSIETGQSVDGATTTSANAVTKRLRLDANSENKQTVPLVTTTASLQPVIAQRMEDYIPSNGKVFSPREVIQILIPLERAPRAALMREWIRKRLVPLHSQEGLRKVLRKARAGKPIAEWWGKKGKHIVTIADLRDDVAQLSVGMSVDSCFVEKMLIARKKQALVAQGKDPRDATIDRKTLASYYAAIAISNSALPTSAGPQR